MIGDYFTKPFQGSLFHKLCNLILGKEEVYVTKYNTKAHECIKDMEQKKYSLTNSVKDGGW